MRRLSIFLIALLLTPALAAAITLGQVDDFQDGTLQGWASGAPNPTPPVNVSGAGPGGAGDRAMIATATGGGGPGSRLVVFNRDQWTGDYLAAGVNAIGLDLLNLGASELAIRVVLRGPGNTYATAQAAILPAGGGAYRRLALSLLPEDLELVGFGAGDVMATLGGVTELRILHSAFPASTGDVVSGQAAVDNVTALADAVVCSPGLLDKVDTPADLLWIPGFEVDTSDAAGRTTFFTVHNQTDEPRMARFEYYDATSSLQVTEDVALGPRQTRPVNLRDVDGLAADPDGVARGWAQVLACAEDGGDLGASFTGDYLFLDPAGNFATGDQLLRYEDLCGTVQVRLVNFGSGVTVRLYSSEPQGDLDPTALFTVYDEAGMMTDNGSRFLDQAVTIFDSTDLSETQFGTLELEFLAGTGAISVEYSAFGLFSVSMTGNCVDSAVVVE